MPDDARRIATERVKWSRTYQDKYGIRSGEARNLPEGKAEEIQHLAKRVYRALGLSGYARIDVRMDAEGQVYVLEANPNPQIAHDEDFSDSAEKAGYTYQESVARTAEHRASLAAGQSGLTSLPSPTRSSDTSQPVRVLPLRRVRPKFLCLLPPGAAHVWSGGRDYGRSEEAVI